MAHNFAQIFPCADGVIVCLPCAAHVMHAEHMPEGVAGGEDERAHGIGPCDAVAPDTHELSFTPLPDAMETAMYAVTIGEGIAEKGQRLFILHESMAVFETREP